MSILGTSFNMDLAGKNAGSMFGPGIYMAESSTCLKTTTKMSASENREPMKTKVSVEIHDHPATLCIDTCILAFTL